MPFASNPAETSVLLEDNARRERTKERLYAIFQLGGWGLYLTLQIVFLPLAPRLGGARPDPLLYVGTLLLMTTTGLLLTHLSRRWIARRGWKQLGWRALLPRTLGLSAVLSLGWILLVYCYSHFVLRSPTSAPDNLPMLLLAYWLNGVVLLMAWFCLYFFYHLYDRLNRFEIERLQLMTTVKDAELRALKSQVNPHFIFNSLNSLRALIDEEPARARQAVTQLANLLRYSLQSGQLETVAFEDELRIVSDYLALEQVRHEERLRVRLDIAPETLALPIPPMLLQTLVENAVKYGISMRPEGGEITIVARRENDALRLLVSNPGELSSTPAKNANVSTGVGLRNAADRLRLLFGDHASLRLRSTGPELVVAEAILPLQPHRA